MSQQNVQGATAKPTEASHEFNSNEYRATYSPDDNKLRLYPLHRLDEETYATVSKAGFKWAPKQRFFVAPAWTPDREDVLMSLAGDIEDEDSTLFDRQSERAERFSGYSEKRAAESNQVLTAVDKLASAVPFGQPILFGHHSERKARRHAAKIDSGMQKAVMLFDRSEYWQDRAAASLAHAKYKELPAVRYRRIKKIEADLRKAEKTIARSEKLLKLWRSDLLDLNMAMVISNNEGNQIKIMGKQILANGVGYAFDLGLETMCPQCKSVKDYLQKLATDVNSMNISTCQASQAIVGGLWPKTQEASRKVCQDIGAAHDVFSDWAASRQGCGVGGENNTVFNKATEEEKKRIPRNRNLTWSTFEKINQFLSNDRELKELIMSMVGTVIYDDKGNPTFLAPRGGSDAIFDTLLNGGTAKIYRCNDNTECLKPTAAEFTLSASQCMTSRVRDLLQSIFTKARTDTRLTDTEKALISSTRVKILRYTIDSASLGLDESILTSLSEYIASDMVMSYIAGLIDMAESSASGSLSTEDENARFRDNLLSVRSQLGQRVSRIQVQQNGLVEFDNNLSHLRQQLSTNLSDRVMSNYEYGE